MQGIDELHNRMQQDILAKFADDVSKMLLSYKEYLTEVRVASG